MTELPIWGRENCVTIVSECTSTGSFLGYTALVQLQLDMIHLAQLQTLKKNWIEEQLLGFPRPLQTSLPRLTSNPSFSGTLQIVGSSLEGFTFQL